MKMLRFMALALMTFLALQGAFAADAKKPVKLVWYFTGSPQPDGDLVYAKANELLAKYGLDVDFKIIDWGSYDEKMRVKIAASEEFDLCFTANWINNYYQNVAKGAFLPLDAMLAKDAPKLKATVPDSIWSATRVDGKVYGLINYQISAMTNGIWFRNDLLDKYKFDPKSVKKISDLEPFLAAVKKGDPSMFPAINNFPGRMIGFVNATLGFDEVGGRAVPGVVRLGDKGLKVVNQFASKEVMDYFKLMRDWYQKGYIRQDAISIKDINPEIKAGRISCGFEGTHKPGGDAEYAAMYGFPVTSVAISKPVLLTSSIIATMNAVSRTSKNPDEAVRFMEILNSDKELYNLVTYGIEGMHYKKLGPNRIEVLPGSKYNTGTAWEFASTFNAYLLPGQPDSVWDDTKKINASAVPSPIIGFNFNPDPVNSEIAQCNSVVDEFLPALETGSYDPAAQMPQFLAKLDKAGAPKIIAEMQKQIDAWKATKK